MEKNKTDLCYLTLEDIENVAHTLAERVLSFDGEPIPTFDTADKAKIKQAINAPKQTLSGEDAYPDIAAKASILLYSMIKNHPWPNGNKRIGMISTFTFLALNDYWVNTTSEDFRITALFVGNSESRCSEKVIDYLMCFFRRKIVSIEEALPFEIGDGMIVPDHQ